MNKVQIKYNNTKNNNTPFLIKFLEGKLLFQHTTIYFTSCQNYCWELFDISFYYFMWHLSPYFNAFLYDRRKNFACGCRNVKRTEEGFIPIQEFSDYGTHTRHVMHPSFK